MEIEEQPQPQPQPHQQTQPDVCAFCVEDPRMHEFPCPGPRPTFPVACGHHVHFLCLFTYSQLNDAMPQMCPACHVPFFTQEQFNWVQQFEIRNIPEPVPNRRLVKKARTYLEPLWTDNADFRKDVKALKKSQIAYGKALRIFRRDKTQIVRRFQQESAPTISYLKSMKQRFVKEYGQMESKRVATRLSASYEQKQRHILRKYNLGHLNDLTGLNEIPKVPRMRSRRELGLYRYRSGRYMFRVRV